MKKKLKDMEVGEKMDVLITRLEGSMIIAIDAIIYFLIALTSAIIKDIYETKTGVRPRIEISRAFVSAILSTFLTLGIRPYVAESWLPAINLILGFIGFELFQRISTIDGLKRTIREVKEMVMDLLSLRNAYDNTNNTNFNNDVARQPLNNTTSTPTSRPPTPNVQNNIGQQPVVQTRTEEDSGDGVKKERE